MTNQLRAVANKEEFVCCLCGDSVPPPDDLLDRIQSLEGGILCESCEDFPMNTTRSFFEKPKLSVVKV